jgi:hypothetical protein
MADAGLSDIFVMLCDWRGRCIFFSIHCDGENYCLSGQNVSLSQKNLGCCNPVSTHCSFVAPADGFVHVAPSTQTTRANFCAPHFGTRLALKGSQNTAWALQRSPATVAWRNGCEPRFGWRIVSLDWGKTCNPQIFRGLIRIWISIIQLDEGLIVAWPDSAARS